MYKIKKKIPFIIIIAFFLFCIFIIYSNIKITDIAEINGNFYTNYNEVEIANKDSRFGKFVSLSFNENELQTGSNKEKEGTILFKLFGLIPIKKVKVNILSDEEAYVGGVPIGIYIQTDGMIVVSDTIIDTDTGTIIKNKNLKSGDIIKKINGTEIDAVEDIYKTIESTTDNTVNIEIIRDNKIKDIKTELIKEKGNKHSLGVWVKDDISGIGTLTFIKKDSGDYGALGHSIMNGNSSTVIPVSTGKIYDCNLIGINKGSKSKPGELKAVFLQKNEKGNISKNTPYGIFGKIIDFDNLVDTNRYLKIGGRLSVKPGKAKIVSSVSGIREEYDIEIIKANFQSKSSDKSIVFRVTDERLLNLTGGIVQGMSGSPIIQNDKIVGAVTHVFLSDSSKGYGVYSDWMLEQLEI